MWKKAVLVIVAVVLLFGSGGCFGEFALTGSVHELNASPQSPIGETLIFWLFAFVLPVYEFSLLLDVFIFNPIEFWSGENPIALAPVPAGAQYAGGGSR